jgi:hypothetical protein
MKESTTYLMTTIPIGLVRVRELGRLDKVAAWLQVRVMVNTVEDLQRQLM